VECAMEISRLAPPLERADVRLKSKYNVVVWLQSYSVRRVWSRLVRLSIRSCIPCFWNVWDSGLVVWGHNYFPNKWLMRHGNSPSYTALAVNFFRAKRPIVSWNTLLNHQISFSVTSSSPHNKKKNNSVVSIFKPRKRFRKLLEPFQLFFTIMISGITSTDGNVAGINVQRWEAAAVQHNIQYSAACKCSLAICQTSYDSFMENFSHIYLLLHKACIDVMLPISTSLHVWVVHAKQCNKRLLPDRYTQVSFVIKIGQGSHSRRMLNGFELQERTHTLYCGLC
jgi:hypothetical protein